VRHATKTMHAPTHQSDERSPVHDSVLTPRSLDDFVGPKEQGLRRAEGPVTRAASR